MNHKKRPEDRSLPGRLGRMTAAELDREVAVFDEEFIAERLGKPLRAADRKLHRRAFNRARRAPAGAAKRVVISIDRRLLRRVYAHAKKLGLSRSRFICTLIESALKRAG